MIKQKGNVRLLRLSSSASDLGGRACRGSLYVRNTMAASAVSYEYRRGSCESRWKPAECVGG